MWSCGLRETFSILQPHSHWHNIARLSLNYYCGITFKISDPDIILKSCWASAIHSVFNSLICANAFSKGRFSLVSCIFRDDCLIVPPRKIILYVIYSDFKPHFFFKFTFWYLICERNLPTLILLQKKTPLLRHIILS